MTHTVPAAQDALPLHAQMIQMAMSYWPSRLVYVAARLGLADHLTEGPRSARELAALTDAHAPSLYRVMRTLAMLGVLTEHSDQRFTLTPLGETLKTGAPGEARASVMTLGGEWVWRSLEEFLYSVQTGKSGSEKALGEPVFDWIAKRPDEVARFSQTMVGVHGTEPAAVAAAYDFGDIGTLVDVGGSTGNVLATVLEVHPEPRGILFDMPHVVRDAKPLMDARGLADRVTIESGSFFETIPSGADAYLLSHIIHDWAEDKCLTILGNCRRAMKPGARLLIVEMVLPEGDEPHPGKLLDMMMLVGPGGQERTAPEYADLLDKAGFSLSRVVPTQSAASIVEGRLK